MKTADVIIVGSGAAGLFNALFLPQDYKVIVITKKTVEESDSFLAQGGISALKNPEDYDSYFEDTMKAGHYENDKGAVEKMIKESPQIIQDLKDFGVRFDLKDGEIEFTREGGHSTFRILHHEDLTGKEITSHLYEEAKKRGLHGLDAPVTGGDSGAKAGTLTILAGGDKEDFDTCLPVFEAIGKAINYEGKSGNGQHTKMCNQIAIAGALAGACEAMVYAKNAGLDVDVMLKSISTGAAGSAQMNNVASKAAKDDYAPGFFLKHFIKDMSLADEEASERGTKLDVLEDVLGICKKLEEEGMGDLGTQALIKHYKW